jgi:hypothetical protein
MGREGKHFEAVPGPGGCCTSDRAAFRTQPTGATGVVLETERGCGKSQTSRPSSDSHGAPGHPDSDPSRVETVGFDAVVP